VLLRRFEIVMSCSASFFFWSLRGALAEKWGHGPHFGAWTEAQNQFTLLPQADMSTAERKMAAMAGIITSSFLWECPEVPAYAEQLAQEWLSDVLETLTPQTVNRVQIRRYFSVPLHDGDEVQRTLDAEYPDLLAFSHEGYSTQFRGATFQNRRRFQDKALTATGTFGIWSKDQRQSWFNYEVPEDREHNLGLFLDHVWLAEDPGFPDPSAAIRDLVDLSRREGQSMRAARLEPHAR
jgi:hypothetical protein